MSKKYVFVADENFLNQGNFTNPIDTLDHKLNEYYPNFYSANYDLRIIAHKLPSYPKTKDYQEFMKEYPALFYDPYIEVALPGIDSLKEICLNKKAKNIFLNSFNLDHLKYIAPYIKETAEIIYFFKCNSIDDLSILSEFPNLECVHIYWNNKLKSLWNMEKNTKLKVLSCDFITKLSNVDDLKKSTIEYLKLDGESHSGYKADFLVKDISIFKKMPNLKYLTLNYKNLNVDY